MPRGLFKPATPEQFRNRQEGTRITTLSEIEKKVDKINGKLDAIIRAKRKK